MMLKSQKAALLSLLGCGLLPLMLGCSPRSAPVTPAADSSGPPEQLSSYGFFHGNGSTQDPVDGVIPYDINTPLFSDYTVKYRFVRLPPGTSAQYHDTDVFDFPVGTTIIKTFAYLNDL